MNWNVTFLPERRTFTGTAPVPLSLAAAACDILLEQPCGARASCGRCKVRVIQGAEPADSVDARVLGERAAAGEWRLGCRVILERDTVIEVPWSSRVVAHKSFGGSELFGDGFQPAGTGFGIALDAGSTTVAAAVIDLATGDVLASASAVNRQLPFGADVMSRIAFARSRPDGSAVLHDALVAGVNALLADIGAAAGIDAQDVASLVAVGNPAMLHALAGWSLVPLGVAPYQGVHYDAWEGDAPSLGLDLPHAHALLLPGVRAHVGADTIAAMLATRIDVQSRPTLLLDLGTNTEVVLASARGITCTSAAAGPAFEGASIRCGVRAGPGAIEQVRIGDHGELLLRVIGDGPATGICGSGLVDAAAELLRVGAIEPSGRLRTADELNAAGLPGLAGRIVPAGPERALTLADGVVLTAGDIRQLQLVKAGIAAAISLLLEDAGVTVAELDTVLLAGTFGSYVRISSALALGLLPAVDPERVRFVGNAAGAGARLALVDGRARERAARLARAARFLELAGHTEYHDAFVAMLPFPEPA